MKEAVWRRRYFVLELAPGRFFHVISRSILPDLEERRDVVVWVAGCLDLPLAFVEAGLVELAEGGDRRCQDPRKSAISS